MGKIPVTPLEERRSQGTPGHPHATYVAWDSLPKKFMSMCMWSVSTCEKIVMQKTGKMSIFRGVVIIIYLTPLILISFIVLSYILMLLCSIQ